jgi:hypothetical protein
MVVALVPYRAEAGSVLRAVRALKVLSVASRAARSYGVSSTGERTLTVSELMACLRRERDLTASDADLSTRFSMLEAESSRLQAADAKLGADAKKVDRTDAAAVARYNKRGRVLVAEGKTHEANIQEFETAAKTFQGEVAAYDAACGGHSYYVDDFAAAEAGLLEEGKSTGLPTKLR